LVISSIKKQTERKSIIKNNLPDSGSL